MRTNDYSEVLDESGYAPSLFDTSECNFCKRTTGKIDRHEVFHGTGRREISKRYGCWVTLCHTCHMMLHNGKLGDYEKKLQKDCQRKAQVHYVWSTSEFIELFGKNYT